MGLDTDHLWVIPILRRGALLGDNVDFLAQASTFEYATCDVLAELGSALAQSSSEAPFGSGKKNEKQL